MTVGAVSPQMPARREANAAIVPQVPLPTGYYIEWRGSINSERWHGYHWSRRGACRSLRAAAGKLGARVLGYVQVLEGLKPGERVVTSATFMIDAESNPRAALATFTAPRLGYNHSILTKCRL
jgi:membrane fusion protein, copper/silver efflux system